MAYLQEQIKILKFDKRLLEINLKNGSITEEEYKQHLAQLKNDEANSEPITFEDNQNDDFKPAPPQEAQPAPVAPSNPFEANGSQPVTSTPSTPTNNDPFGSGF